MHMQEKLPITPVPKICFYNLVLMVLFQEPYFITLVQVTA